MNATMPKPSDCRTGERAFVSTFGKCELETIACTLTILSQQRGDKWLTNFTVKDVHSLYKWPRRAESCTLHWLNMLAEDGWLDASTIKKKGWFRTRAIPCFSINEHFANKVYRAQARNVRLGDPNNPNREQDVMAAIGLIPD